MTETAVREITGIERLRALGREQEERSWSTVGKVRGRLMLQIADQIERELTEALDGRGEEVTDVATVRADAMEAYGWARERGGLDAVRRALQDAENRRAELCSALGVDAETGWSDAMEEVRTRVRRPAPKALDVDGAEIRVGDVVYLTPGDWCGEYPLYGCPAGCKMRVLQTRDVDHSVKGVIKCRNMTPGAVFTICYPQPSQLTHVRLDSWERLEEDSGKDCCSYFGVRYQDCGQCSQSITACSIEKARDIVRRARALAERGR